jgi:poly(hydroxyalkanoate) depolymerase family esterase
MFKKHLLRSVLVASASLAGAVGVSTAGAAGTVKQLTLHDRTNLVFVPSGHVGTKVPAVMVLHGCGQSPESMMKGTRFNELAEKENFIVIYPEQTSAHNGGKCWNWFRPQHQERGSGEPKVLTDLLAAVESQYEIDKHRRYVTGLSAGGAMATIMGVTYPDVFAAVGSHSGLQYKAAENLLDALGAMFQGAGPDPDQQGTLAYELMGKALANPVPVIVFHGSLDTTVVPRNAEQTISQWAQTNDLADDHQDNASVTDSASAVLGEQECITCYPYTRYLYPHTRTGESVLEMYMVDGMGHAWSGGDPIESNDRNFDPNGPNATHAMWSFFQRHAQPF